MQTEAQKRATKKYQDKKMKLVSVNMPVSLHNEIMIEVEKQNTNRNAYIIKAVKEKLTRDTGTEL